MTVFPYVIEPERGGGAYEILSEQVVLMPQPSSVMTSLNDGQSDSLAKESKFQDLAGESAEVPPVCPGEKQRQTDVEKEERNAGLGQDKIAKYVGRKVLKRFGRKEFIGDVVNYEPEYKWYKVAYKDGDEEDLETAEVEPILLPPESVDEDGHERDLKKMKEVQVGKPCREGNKERLRKSKRIQKNLEAVADSQGYKGNGFSDRQTLAERLRARGRDSDIEPTISMKPGKPFGRLLQKNTSGVTGYKTVSSVIKNKKAKVGQGSFGSSQKDLSSNIASPCKLKVLKEQKGGEEKLSQELEDAKNNYSPFKNEYKERRRSGTGITLQEGIQRYLQKLKDAQQKTIPRAKRKAVVFSNATPGTKHAKKKTTQNFSAAVNAFSEGLDDSNQSNRASNHSIVEGHDADDVNLGATLVGRTTRKKFSGVFYRGNVVSYDKKTKFYKVIYEDGDQEDLEWSELEPTLVLKRKQNAPAKLPETTNNAATSFSEGLIKCNQGNRASKCSKVEGRNLDGVEQGATKIGRSIRKKFNGKFYIGNVISYDKKTKFYKVRYEDGDQEDLEWSELEPTLVVKRKQNAPAKSTSAKGAISMSISDKRRKTRSTPD